MVTKAKANTARKKGNKGRLKTLNLKRETLKNLTSREQKLVKGKGGLASSVSAHPTDDRAGNSGF